MNDLLELTDLETYLGVAPSCTQGQLDTAVAIVRGHCRWHLGVARTDTVERCLEGQHIYLPTLRMTELVSVTINGVDYDIDLITWKPEGSLFRLGGFGWSYPTALVEFTHGWDDPLQELADVVGVIAQIAARLPAAVTVTTSGTVAPIQASIDGYSYRLPDHSTGGVALSLTERLILDPHKLTNTP